MEQTSAYSVFPNDGVRSFPRYITRVTDYEGRVLEEDFPDVKDVISERTARIMTSMLSEVVLHGTGIAAAKLPFPVAGKTGTTNDFTDAWFVGFSPTMTCGVWVGYDEKKSLGAKETGAHAALPDLDELHDRSDGRKRSGQFQPPPVTHRRKSRYARRGPCNRRSTLAVCRISSFKLISPERFGRHRTIYLNPNLRRMQQGVVNQTMMHCAFYPCPILLAEFDRTLDLDAKIVNPRWILQFVGRYPYPCSLGCELMFPQILRDIETGA